MIFSISPPCIAGAVAIVWFAVWCFVVCECPADHPTISRNEIDYIQQGTTFRKMVGKVSCINIQSVICFRAFRWLVRGGAFV